MDLSLRNSLSAGNQAYALISTFFFVSIGLMISASIVSWCTQSGNMTSRNSSYLDTVFVAEAAVEKVAAHVIQDFKSNQVSYIRSRVSAYQNIVPSSSETPLLASYVFYDNRQTKQKTGVQCTSSSTYGAVPGTSPSLFGYYDQVTISSVASNIESSSKSASMVEQTLKLVEAPLFQFQFFYQPDLEIGFSSAFNVSGWTHSNSRIYLDPGAALTFKAGVTAQSSIKENKSPLNPESSGNGAITFSSTKEPNYKNLSFRLGTAMTEDELRQIIEKPPFGENANSLRGKQRFYNKADLIIRVTTNNTIVATSGSYNAFSTLVSSKVTPFVDISDTFYDRREDRYVYVVEINISALRQNFNSLKSSLGRDPNTIYIVDERNLGWGAMGGIRLINGSVLPTGGLTIATPNPVYIFGHYNAPTSHQGTTNTTAALASAILADAVTVLSPNWKDANSTKSISSRKATAVTVNTAIITGIVPSNGWDYSGGVENALRTLEDWKNITLTFNGSIAVLYFSEYADSPWSDHKQIYSAPVRQWNWDPYLATSTKQPPNAPFLSIVVRDPWERKGVSL